MTLDELEAEFRRIADDTAATPLYAAASVPGWAAEAETEACIRGRLLYDDSSDFLTYTLDPADLSNLVLEPVVQVIDAAWYTPTSGGRARKLDLVGLDWINERNECQPVTGKPTALARVGVSGLRLWPTPDSNAGGTLALHVYRTPLMPMEEGDDEPEIDPIHHAGLVHWICYRAFQTKDGEEGDAALSAMHYNLFEAQFGARPTANALRQQAAKRRVTTRYGGIP